MNGLQSAQRCGAVLLGLVGLGLRGGEREGSGLSFVFLASLLHVYLFGTSKPPFIPRAFYQVLLN